MPKILYIDDDIKTLEITSSLLKNLIPDCVVFSATSGPEGIKKAKKEAPDTILLDIKMPEMDGYEVCRRLKSDKITKNIPVILITGIKTDTESRVKGLEIGADAFISKPVDKSELVAQINVMLRIKNAEDLLRKEKDLLKDQVQKKSVKLHESEELFRILFDRVFDAVVVINEKGNVVNVNETTRRLLGYSKEESLELSIKDLHPGKEIGKVKDAIKRVLKTGIDYMGETVFITKDNKNIPVEAGSVSFIAGDKTYILASFRDITEHKRAKRELLETNIRLKKSIEGTVNALASTIEKRDPYTAGHQQRVAKLASAIAKELKLSDTRIEGIRIAGLLHDIGKISIPAEILNKPGRLTEIEFDFIKNHPQIAFDVLKDIEFPWPVASIVLQHHEKMNGSGYPKGLNGEKILLESRILTVSDVVEAMSSHRPYRPAFDIKVVLKEITDFKNKYFDIDVVEACLLLFSKGKFKFE